MKKINLLKMMFLAAIMLFGTSVMAQTPNVVISGVYGAGGNSGAPVLSDYVELYNTTASPIDIGGWTIYYAAATGTNVSAANAFTFPAGTFIGANGFLLLRGGVGNATATQTDPYTFDVDMSDGATNVFSMAAGNGKVLLLSTNTSFTASNSLPNTLAGIQALDGFVDYVPYGTATPTVGTAVATLTATTAATRTITGTTVAYTPDMGADFEVVTLTETVPRNSSTTLGVGGASTADGDCEPNGFYSILGQKLNYAPERGVYIVTYSNCEAKKFVKK